MTIWSQVGLIHKISFFSLSSGPWLVVSALGYCLRKLLLGLPNINVILSFLAPGSIDEYLWAVFFFGAQHGVMQQVPQSIKVLCLTIIFVDWTRLTLAILA